MEIERGGEDNKWNGKIEKKKNGMPYFATQLMLAVGPKQGMPYPRQTSQLINP